MIKRIRPFLLLLALWFATGSSAHAHESRPAYLELTETAPGRYDVLWRTPVLSGMRLPVVVRFPATCRNVIEPSEKDYNDSLVERRVIDAGSAGLAGQRIEFPGLQATITDVLVRVARHNGATSTTLVHPSQAAFTLTATPELWSVAGAFLSHGIEHILFGFDHLLFVFGLMLLVRDRWMLLKTITAFTVAHSITLTLASLDVVRLPGPPVEAAIALSIVLLAVEIMRRNRGQSSLAARWPWVIAFAFGLLHGFGFASALTEIGLPRQELPLALFTFNVGVEIGQLAFVAAVLTLRAILLRCRLPAVVLRHAPVACSYVLGTLATFWFFQRLEGF